MPPGANFLKNGIKIGLIAGAVSVLISLIGMVEAFSQRFIIADAIALGQALLLTVAFFAAYRAAAKDPPPGVFPRLLGGGVAGLTIAALLGAFVLLGWWLNFRKVFINASPLLFKLLVFGREGGAGILLLLGAGLLTGLAAGLFSFAPPDLRRTLGAAFGAPAALGILQDLLSPTFALWGSLGAINDWLYEINGLSPGAAVFLFVFAGLGTHLWRKKKAAVRAGFERLSPAGQKAFRTGGWFAVAVLLLALPHVLGLFLSEVLTIVGLYVLLGLGLNIVVGYAGLLDLGYVAFFAIGSYTIALLTSPELGFFNLSFWSALPFAVLLGVIFGAFLGIPVLKMRGDYLAIATLGFGEIIRILVLSDFLRPWLGGAQGVGKIPKMAVGALEFDTPQEIYYFILAGCLIVGFISFRLRDSRLGRAWMAVREDEDVAQAMGINLVATKLMAFATGAGFSALSGAIFAAKLGSVYPHSFNVMISINILCVIIVGGLGSIPGVILGAVALVGLPELLREFAEYRLLVYGAVLVAMMILRPEGLWPEALRRRELHEGEEEPEEAETAAEAGGGKAG
jgi:branched-chain amino acid transport system permease protein